jgi:signal transduction histidine kinase
VLEQIVRAVAYDQAVERGRSEERARIAQDLHDDIGARLLTLMYQAQNPGMEDYIRQTLKDLKTLTRGLAATDHHLSHAVGEWKADITQRLVAAHIELHWSFQYDHDLALSMTQWSALTRILRELVTNAIYHANAAHVTIEGKLEDGAFYLTVSDDGRGTDPRLWAHGLGLGGIRKRVKTLNGDVTWLQQPTGGVRCEVKVSKLTETS